MLGTEHEDVQRLQHFLNVVGNSVADEGAGAYGTETMYFGPFTQAALGAFQINQGIVKDRSTAGYGVLNEATRRRINEMSFALP